MDSGGLQVSNLEFLKTLYQGAPEGANGHVTGFDSDPDDLSVDNARAVFAGSPVSLPLNGTTPALVRNVDWNTYASMGSYYGGRRLKSNLAAIHAVFIDDVGTKGANVITPDRLPLAPSWLIETAPGNFQAGYLLSEPAAVQADNWQRLANALSSAFGDPGVKDLARYLRLPAGRNMKAKYGVPFRHVLHKWHPGRRYSIGQIAQGFGIDLSHPSHSAVGDGTGAEEWRTALLSGENLHESINRLAGRYLSLGIPAGEVCAMLEGLMQSSDAPRDARFLERLADIPRSVQTAIDKGFVREALELRMGDAEEVAAYAARDEAASLAPPPTAREFLDMEFPVVSPLLGPVATQQLVILYAPPGVGKTMLALAMGWAIACGRDFIGWKGYRAANVLVIDGEMAAESMQGRLAAAGHDRLHVANLPNWASSEGYEPINLCLRSGAETVNAWADATGSEVIILDNLMSLAWLDGVSMNSDEFWQPVRRFCVWQRSLGRTVIVVDHSNKSGSLHGTGTKLWHADLAMELRGLDSVDPALQNATGSARFSLRFAKVRGTSETMGQDTEEKVIQLGKVGHDWIYEVGKEEKKRRAREMAMNDLTIRDIAEELGAPKSTVARWIKGFKR